MTVEMLKGGYGKPKSIHKKDFIIHHEDHLADPMKYVYVVHGLVPKHPEVQNHIKDMKSKGYDLQKLHLNRDLTMHNYDNNDSNQKPEHHEHIEKLKSNLDNLNDSDKKWASSMIAYHKKHGKLSEKQLNIVHKLKDKKND